MEEADEILPAQEIDLLIRRHTQVHSEGPSDSGEPLSGVPEEFT